MARFDNMIIPAKYTINHSIVSLLTKIAGNKISIQSRLLPKKIVANLTRISLLKSSIYSARIEGNSLTPDDVENPSRIDEKEYERREIENILNALSYMQGNIPDTLNLAYLLKLHKFVMNKLAPSGVLRAEPSAIFDNNGNVVYMPPPPSEMSDLLTQLLTFINDKTEISPLIKAPLAHLAFEKIHPFLDGNGRVGRLLFQTILSKHDYHFNWLLSIEELLAQKKQMYYTLLDRNDGTEFITFMLEIILEETEKLRTYIEKIDNPSEEDFLLPRRREILEIIKDHELVSFEQIQRRFFKIPARTLHYDIKQLEKEGFIKKLGSTRGALYQAKKR